jgi:hypothetical protein
MKRTLFLISLLTLTLFLLVPFAFAKDSPDRITIWGPSLSKPIEIIDPQILKGFDPWNGQFLDKSSVIVAQEPQIEQTYYIFFYFRDKDGEFREFYTFQYAPNSADRQGFIYLPREGEPWYRVNGQTILRDSGWHYASKEWDALMKQTLENNKVSSRGSGFSKSLQVVPIIMAIGGTAAIWLLRRSHPRHSTISQKLTD